MLLEIALNTGSVVLEGAVTRHSGVQDAAAPPAVRPPPHVSSMLAHFMVHLYIAVVCK